MKRAVKLIPSIPKIPTIPSTPSIPGGNASPPQGGIPGGGIPGGGMPAGIMATIKGISEGIGKFNPLSHVDVPKLIREFPLDNYRDESGKVCCPASAEERAEFKKSFGA